MGSASRYVATLLIATILLTWATTSWTNRASGLPQGGQNKGRILYLANSLPSPIGALTAAKPTSQQGQKEPLNNSLLVFSLPPLQGGGASLGGPASIILSLSSDKNSSAVVQGLLQIDTLKAPAVIRTLTVNSTVLEFSLNFTVSPLPLVQGSTIYLSLSASSISPQSAQVFLHWGSTLASSRLVLPITNYASIDSVRITDAANNENRTFNVRAPAGFNLVNIVAKVRDVFGPDITSLGGDISAVNITITGPSGPLKSANSVNMSRIVPPDQDNLATYRFPWYYTDAIEGSYLVTLDILDSQGVVITDTKGPYSFALGPPVAPFPLLAAAISAGGLGVAGLATGAVYVRRRRGREYLAPFSYFERMTGGEVPGGSMVTVEGNTGAGKTTLCSEVMYEDLKRGRPCIYVAADDFPERIRDQMRNLGIDVAGYENRGLLSFVDCYSAEAGRIPTEKLSVSSVGDLTTLGVKISSALQDQKGTCLYLDSLSPFVPRAKPESIVSFVHAIGAKVRGLDGKAFFTMSTGSDETIQRQMEDMADCVIQMEAFEEKDVRRRRLRIRKFRNRRHQENWATFTIEDGKGIIFYTKQSRRSN